jgi:hypothetical protein
MSIDGSSDGLVTGVKAEGPAFEASAGSGASVQGAWACLDLLGVALRWSVQRAQGLKAVLSSDEGAEALEWVEALAECLNDVVETARRPRAAAVVSSPTQGRAPTKVRVCCCTTRTNPPLLCVPLKSPVRRRRL